MGIEEPDMVMASAGQGTAVGLLGRRGGVEEEEEEEEDKLKIYGMYRGKSL
jgi:hypothetical protein